MYKNRIYNSLVAKGLNSLNCTCHSKPTQCHWMAVIWGHPILHRHNWKIQLVDRWMGGTTKCFFSCSRKTWISIVDIYPSNMYLITGWMEIWTDSASPPYDYCSWLGCGSEQYFCIFCFDSGWRCGLVWFIAVWKWEVVYLSHNCCLAFRGRVVWICLPSVAHSLIAWEYQRKLLYSFWCPRVRVVHVLAISPAE